MPAYRLVQNTTGLFRGKDERGFKTWRYTLEELVSFLAAFKASRSHDTIYAILGLASDFEPKHAARPRSIIDDNDLNLPAANIQSTFKQPSLPPLEQSQQPDQPKSVSEDLTIPETQQKEAPTSTAMTAGQDEASQEVADLIAYLNSVQ